MDVSADISCLAMAREHRREIDEGPCWAQEFLATHPVPARLATALRA